MESNEQRKIVKRVVKQPNESEKTSNTTTLKNISYVVLFFMVFVIFVRGFNVKSTVNEQSELTRSEINALITEQVEALNNTNEVKLEMLKNEILSSYALYSRLNVTELKEREDYHQQQLSKWEKVANSQVTKNDINNIHKEIQQLKDTVNDGTKVR